MIIGPLLHGPQKSVINSIYHGNFIHEPFESPVYICTGRLRLAYVFGFNPYIQVTLTMKTTV